MTPGADRSRRRTNRGADGPSAAQWTPEGRFREIFEGAAIGIAIVGMDGRPQRCNSALERILGYSETELSMMTFAEFTHPDDLAADSEMFEELRAGARDHYQIEKRYVHKNRGIVWARLSISLLPSSGERSPQVIAMVEDITATREAQAEQARLVQDLRAAEHSLRRSQERLTLALSSAGMGIWEWDIVSDRVRWTEELERLAGLEPGGFPGTYEAFRAMVHPEDRESVRAAIRRAIKQPSRGDAFESEFRLERADGEIRWIVGSGRVIRDANGQPIEMLGMAHDVTGLRELEQQLRQSQKVEAMGRLAGGVAHDFNNLLTAIKGYSEFVIEAMHPDDHRRRDVEGIASAADRAASLTRQLLAFSRKQVLAPKVLDVNAIVFGIEKLLRRLIGATIELEVTLAPSVVATRGDAGQMEQVLMNLAVNARDAMPTGGTLSIETHVDELPERTTIGGVDLRAGRYVVIAVRDNGTGMTSETKARLFEPFFTTKEQGRGTGLGLATVDGIVRQSGGAIRVDSEIGKGSTFAVFLPWVDPEPETPARVAMSQPSLGGTERVLIVDDDDAVRILAARALAAHGYRVSAAANGQEALDMVRSGEAFDLVVTDVVMPRLQGPGLVAQARALHPELPVLYMTGFTEQGIESLSTDASVLEKPFTPARLLRGVRALLDGR